MDTSGDLQFVHGPFDTAPEDVPPDLIAKAVSGDIWEQSSASEVALRHVCQHLRSQPSYALFIDYGHEQSGFGDTLQAVKNHKYANVLENPGDADLTTHVDFERVSKWARNEGCVATAIQTQAAFLRALGIEERAETLKASATPIQAKSIDEALDRLISPGKMGRLFKALAIHSMHLPPPPGFKAGSDQ